MSTTFMTGVMMARKGLAKPVGSMTQYDKIRVGRGENKKYLHYKDIVPLAKLDDIVFAAWDVYPANAYESAINAEVLKEKDIEPVKDELLKIKPLKAAFDKNYAKRLDGDNVKQCKDRWDMMEQVREDIRNFKKESGVDRVVVLWAASTEIYVAPDKNVHYKLDQLEAAMKANDVDHISPSMCYAYAALKEDCPFIMGAPNTTVDIPAMWQLSDETKVPIAGKDFKTGQTLVKSGFAPIIGARMLGMSGWFSTNILGNRDGLVLDEPANFRTKEVSKLSTLESILVADEALDASASGGVAAAAGKATAVVTHKAKSGAAKAKAAAAEKTAKAKPAVRTAARKTGEAVEAGSFAVGRQIGRASGMFAAFKEEFDKASKGEDS